jgi:hypothetical protein
LDKWNVGNGFWLLKGIKNLTKKLLRCSIFAKIVEKKETLNSKPQKLGKMELWKWILEIGANQEIKPRLNHNLL